MLRGLALALAIALLAAAPPTEARAQAPGTSYRALDGATEHRFFVTGLVGLYFVGAPDAPPSALAACVVMLAAMPPGAVQTPSFAADIALVSAPGRPRCDRAAIPQLVEAADGVSGAIVVTHAGAAVRLATETRTSLQLAYGSDSAAARGAAASIAHAVSRVTDGSCGFPSSYTAPPPTLVSAFCDVGLHVDGGDAGAAAFLAVSHRYGDQRGHCEAFTEAHDFEEIALTGYDSACTRGEHLVTRDSTESELSEALGACAPIPGGTDLRCGRFVVSRSLDGGLLTIRRAH